MRIVRTDLSVCYKSQSVYLFDIFSNEIIDRAIDKVYKIKYLEYNILISLFYHLAVLPFPNNVLKCLYSKASSVGIALAFDKQRRIHLFQG